MKAKFVAALLCIVPLTAIVVTSALLARTDPHDEHILLRPGDVQWQEGPDVLPRGAEIAVLEGDPTAEGIFTLRLRLPAEYRIPPHTHPGVERVTVLSGAAFLGQGREFDEGALEELSAGSYFVLHPGMEHFFATADEETIIQITSIGPWAIQYVNPEDDPRR